MRGRGQTTARRTGPKLSLPAINSEKQLDDESPYYTIDNTEDIYGTMLLPSQRCYVDPWDLENYDYVRKKLDVPTSTNNCYDASLSTSAADDPIATNFYYIPQSPSLSPSSFEESPSILLQQMATTTSPKRRRRSHFQCEMECCTAAYDSGFYGFSGRSKYKDHLMYMTVDIQNREAEKNVYNGYRDYSTTSNFDSSIGEEESISTFVLHTPSGVLPNPAPKFPAPPPYDYCNPYDTLPYCSTTECYECLQQQQQLGTSSLFHAADDSLSILKRRIPSYSLYGGIYADKFGLSQKGLLQIDYSCSWSDLDRVIGRNN